MTEEVMTEEGMIDAEKDGGALHVAAETGAAPRLVGEEAPADRHLAVVGAVQVALLHGGIAAAGVALQNGVPGLQNGVPGLQRRTISGEMISEGTCRRMSQPRKGQCKWLCKRNWYYRSLEDFRTSKCCTISL